jgi:hypothetical protein
MAHSSPACPSSDGMGEVLLYWLGGDDEGSAARLAASAAAERDRVIAPARG